MKRIISVIILGVCFLANGQTNTIKRTSDYPRVTSSDPLYLFLLAATNTTPHTNFSISYGSLRDQIVSESGHQFGSDNLTNWSMIPTNGIVGHAALADSGWPTNWDWSVLIGIPYNWATNTYAGITNALGFVPATNGASQGPGGPSAPPTSIRTVSDATAITTADYCIIYTNGAATNLITLPLASGISNVFVIKNISVYPGAFILTNANGIDTIDLGLAITNRIQMQSVTVQSDGTSRWWIQ